MLDRLTSAVDGSLTVKWSYDANGNRLTQTYASSSTFNISSTSNQITSTTGALVRTYAYDAAGNPTSYGTSVLAYNDRGRLASDSVGSTSSTMVYNALGQMIEYNFGSTSTMLLHDEAGHILGEYYANSGYMLWEYIWMGDIPVAQIVQNVGSVTVYYIHTDQLNAPRKITLPSSNALVWRWDPHPFGEATPNQNPSGLGTFYNNLRFPGQYYTAESGLNHNGFRDYDPQTGKYLQPDPIGLAGRSYSTYAYAGGNPLSFIDPLGFAAHLNLINATTDSQLALYKWGQSYQPDQYNTILVHVTDDGGYSPDTTGPVRVSPEVIAEELKELSGYDPNLPTQLIACSAGAHPESVQRLADALNDTVLASPQTLVSNPPAGPPLAQITTPSTWWGPGSVVYQTPIWIPYPPSNRR